MTHMRGLIFTLTAFIIFPVSAGWGQSSADSSIDSLIQASQWERMKQVQPLTYYARRVTEEIVIDGVLNENVWKNTPVSSRFNDIRGAEFGAADQLTHVQIAWDMDFLYLAAVLQESDLFSHLTHSDQIIWYDNDFEVFIDPDGDTHHYFELEMNTAGVTNEVYFSASYGDFEVSDRKAFFEGLKIGRQLRGTLNDRRDTDIGWTLELAFPWKSFTRYSTDGKAPRPGSYWRMNFARVDWELQSDSVSIGYVKRPEVQERNWTWSPQGMIAMHIPELWGYVVFGSQDEYPLRLPDPNRRDCLLDTYYRQQVYHSLSGVWATSLSDLFHSADLVGRCPLLSLEADADGFIATYGKEQDSASIDHRRHLSFPATRVRTVDLR